MAAKEKVTARHSGPQRKIKVPFQRVWEASTTAGQRRINGALYIAKTLECSFEGHAYIWVKAFVGVVGM